MRHDNTGLRQRSPLADGVAILKEEFVNRRGILTLSAALAISMVLSGCGKGSQQKSARAGAPPPSVPVGVATVKQRDFDVYLTGLGSVTAFNTVSLKTRIDGQIMQVNFREGQDVKAGELLILIDPRPYQVALNQAQAQLTEGPGTTGERAGAIRTQQSVVRTRCHRQAGPGYLQASFGTFQATIDADKAAIDSAKLNLVYCRHHFTD